MVGKLGAVTAVGVAIAAAFSGGTQARADASLTPGIKISDESSFCTSAFAAQGNDGNYYLMTSGHCDAHDGSVWRYGDDESPLGKVTAQEYAESPETGTQTKDAALIRLDPSAVGRHRRQVSGPRCVES